VRVDPRLSTSFDWPRSGPRAQFRILHEAIAGADGGIVHASKIFHGQDHDERREARWTIYDRRGTVAIRPHFIGLFGEVKDRRKKATLATCDKDGSSNGSSTAIGSGSTKTSTRRGSGISRWTSSIHSCSTE
jgi:hypothetical protein